MPDITETFGTTTVDAIVAHATLARTARTYATKAKRSANNLADVFDVMRATPGEWTNGDDVVATVKAPAQRDDMAKYVADLESALLALGGTLPTKGTLTSRAAISW